MRFTITFLIVMYASLAFAQSDPYSPPIILKPGVTYIHAGHPENQYVYTETRHRWCSEAIDYFKDSLTFESEVLISDFKALLEGQDNDLEELRHLFYQNDEEVALLLAQLNASLVNQEKSIKEIEALNREVESHGEWLDNSLKKKKTREPSKFSKFLQKVGIVALGALAGAATWEIVR